MNHLVFLTPNTQELLTDSDSLPPMEYRTRRFESSAGCVYVVEDSESHRCKIGQSINPERRTRTILTQSGIKNGRVYISKQVVNHADCEKFVHNALKESRHFGEWFSCPFETAVDTVDRIIQKFGTLNRASKLIKFADRIQENITEWFLNDSPELLEWFNNNSLEIRISGAGIPNVAWYEHGEMQEMGFDLFATLLLSEDPNH